MKTAIVLTTIAVPNLLEGHADNYQQHGHEDVEFIVIGDLKTPKETEKVIRNIRGRGFEAEYFDIPKQEKWLQNQDPELKRMIPYNSDNRRNIGFLIAVERGAEVIVSIDDDNYVTGGDYLGGHKIVGTTQTLKTAESSNRWFNPCSMMETETKRAIYPRGFPYSKRWKDEIRFIHSSGRVVMNGGLWLRYPDLDAVTNLNEKVKTVAINSEQIMLATGTFSPINTQNTAFHRDILPCYYYIVMGAQINGYRLDRYGDIWSGFFAKKIIDHLGDRVTFGHPLTDHRRNIHDLFKDLQQELWGMVLTDKLVPIMESINLSKKTYSSAYLELAGKLEDDINRSSEFSEDEKAYVSQIASNMRVWVRVCDRIMG